MSRWLGRRAHERHEREDRERDDGAVRISAAWKAQAEEDRSDRGKHEGPDRGHHQGRALRRSSGHADRDRERHDERDLVGTDQERRGYERQRDPDRMTAEGRDDDRDKREQQDQPGREVWTSVAADEVE